MKRERSALVVQTLDRGIRQIDHYPENSVIHLKTTVVWRTSIFFLFSVFRAKARAVSDVIVNITDALVKAAGSQAAARDAINTAENDIKMANDTLSKVRNDNT